MLDVVGKKNHHHHQVVLSSWKRKIAFQLNEFPAGVVKKIYMYGDETDEIRNGIQTLIVNMLKEWWAPINSLPQWDEAF